MNYEIRNHLLFVDGKQVSYRATPNRSGIMNPDTIIDHDTASNPLDPSGDIGWLTMPVAKASAHVVIDWKGRITQLAETGDGRYLVTLTGIARFRVVEEVSVETPYRQCQVDFSSFLVDFIPRAGEDQVDRDGILRALRDFAETNDLQIDWGSIDEAPNEALVNALSMMSPFGPKEKQALLEAQDLKGRADVLVAITEFEIARGKSASTPLQ